MSSEPEGVACPTCHTMNEAGWAFCQQCGSKLPQSANQPPVEPPRPMDPQTVVAQPVRDMGSGLGQPIEPPPQEPPYVMGQQTVPNQPVAPPRPAPPPPEPPPPQLGRPTVVSQPSPPREPNIPLGQPTVMDQPATQPPPQQRFNPPQGMSTESVQSMPSKGMGGVPCQQCGHLNNMGSAFCASCGTPIPVAKTIVMSSVAAAPKGRLHLIMEGGQQGEVYELKDDTMIGRVGGEITFPHDGFMSGRHARIVRKGNSFVLTDEGSRNGTFIKIKDEVELKPGDMILIGKQLFKFEV